MDMAQEPAAQDSADGKRDEESDEDERGVELRILVDREAGEERDVDKGSDQR